jgi:Ca2+/H+ antiporter
MPTVDATLPPFPKSALLDLVGFVDAAHATDLKTRRSVTGYVFTLAGGAIAYKSKLQTTVATSSTELEFVAAVSAAKVAKYLCSVLNQLGFHQDHPTTRYEDNEAAIKMINESKPTPRSRHIDIQHFAIQEWRQEKSITMKYISTLINIADQKTKALGWTLHLRHARRSMGHYGV